MSEPIGDNTIDGSHTPPVRGEALSRYSLHSTPLYRPDSASLVDHDREELDGLPSVTITELDRCAPTQDSIPVPLMSGAHMSAANVEPEPRQSFVIDEGQESFEMVSTTVTYLGSLCHHLQAQALAYAGQNRGSRDMILGRAITKRLSIRAAERSIAKGQTQCWRCRAERKLDVGLGQLGRLCFCQSSAPEDDGDEGAPIPVPGRQIPIIQGRS